MQCIPCCDEKYLGCWACFPVARDCSSICAISKHRTRLKDQKGMEKEYWRMYNDFLREQGLSPEPEEAQNEQPTGSSEKQPSDGETTNHLLVELSNERISYEAYAFRASRRNHGTPPLQPLNLEILFR